MNCKPGDLAVVIWASMTPELVGAIVNCMWLADPTKDRFVPSVAGPTWRVSGGGRLLPHRDTSGNLQYVTERFVADAMLRPIRDQPGEDEMLSIAGKPQDQREPA